MGDHKFYILDPKKLISRIVLIQTQKCVSNQLLAICCYSGVPGLRKSALNLILKVQYEFHFSCVLGSVVDCVNDYSSARTLKICLA